MYDVTDDRGVPISHGVPVIVRIAFVIGVIGIFLVVGIVIATSQQGHLWPASETTKIKI